MKKYLIRLDDACPTMDAARWQRMESILDKYGVRPMVGIIPANADSKQMIDKEDGAFWEKALAWQNKGWTIALHGFDHCYIFSDSGINPLWARSEFAGLSLETQKQKIKDGVEIMRLNGINPKYFFAPSHTFDDNTLTALKECSDIRIISDTIALKPYKYRDFIFIPQIGGHCFNAPVSGVFTFCFHPSVMSDKDFIALEVFIRANKDKFYSFDELKLEGLKDKSMIDKFLSWIYFTQRKLRGIR